jgi:hypothetical protein
MTLRQKERAAMRDDIDGYMTGWRALVREGKKGAEPTLTGIWTRALWAEIRAEWDEEN